VRKTYNYTVQHCFEPAPELIVEWDLTKYYQDIHDPQIEKDLRQTERAYERFTKQFSDLIFVNSTKGLREALEQYFKLSALRPSKPLRYFHFRTTLDAHDASAAQRLNQLQNRLVKASNKILFFTQTIARLSEKKQSRYLKASELQLYRYWLEKLFTQAPHLLSLEVEQVLRRKSLPAFDLWVRGTEQILGKETIWFRKRELPLLGAIEQVSSADTKTRSALWLKLTEALKKVAPVATNELQAVVLDAEIDDDLRHYDVPYASTVQNYENERPSVERLVANISKKGFQLSRRFYRNKATYHGVTPLLYTDRFRDIGKAPKFSYADTVTICRDVFYGLRPEYGRFFDKLISGGNVDVYPKAGKQGGAFMASGIKEPIMLKLNHTDDFGSLKTMAHEMGHAVHTFRTHETQPTPYQGYSTVTAETASTFFERAVWQAVYNQADEATRLYLLHHKISNDIATMQRQIAFFNFELAMHEMIRENGGATKEELAKCMQQKLQDYMGKAVHITEQDGYSYVYVSHLRRSFYVYAYAYGHLMSEVMYRRLEEDPKFIDSVDNFLCSGNSLAVEDTFRSIEIDPVKDKTFNFGLQSLDKNITQLEKLLK